MKLEVRFDNVFKEWVIYTFKINDVTGDKVLYNIEHFPSEDRAVRIAKFYQVNRGCQLDIFDKFGISSQRII